MFVSASGFQPLASLPLPIGITDEGDIVQGVETEPSSLPVSRIEPEDELSISAAARAAHDADRDAESDRSSDDRSELGAPGTRDDLSKDERAQVEELQARDREVRAHERAHQAAAGDLAVGGPTYSYQTGPDGKRYAIGGEVQIRLRSGRTPEETVRNMERAVRAAGAPDSPSAPDRAVAAQAERLADEARAEQRNDETNEPSAATEPRRRVDTYA